MVSRRSHTVGRRWMNEYEALVKRYWERETELLGENPIQFHFVHHNSKCHGILGLPLWQASEWQPESRHDRQFMFCHGWRVGCLGLLVPVGKTAFEMWWHTHIKQISSFGETDRVHLNRRGCQFSRLLAAEVCASAVVILDTSWSEVVWRVLATHSIRQCPFHFPSRASPRAITFQPDSITFWWHLGSCISEVCWGVFSFVCSNILPLNISLGFRFQMNYKERISGK